MTPATLLPDDYLRIADRLPPGPQIIPQLMTLLADPDSHLGQIVDLVSFDPGLTSKILRACNSAAVGLSEPVLDVSEAVNRLGVEFVYNLAASVCGGSSFHSGTRPDLASELWQHSVTSAFAAEILAADLELDRGTLFTAALLHDIGKMVLAEKWQDSYWNMVEQTEGAPHELPQQERQTFQFTHGELGGRVLAHWKFPPAIATSVWQHHAPAPGIPFERETACLTVAEAIAEDILRPASAQPVELTPEEDTALGVLGLTSDTLSPYVSRTRENFHFVQAFCQVHS